jgi:hypothetical protein
MNKKGRKKDCELFFELLSQKEKLPKDYFSAVWRSHQGGIHNFASPPRGGFAFSMWRTVHEGRGAAA